MDQASQRDLRILREISESQDITQRGLAKTLGIALGLTNLYLKRLARKGYIKISTIPPNRLKYLLTPQGIAEKSRLTYEYISFSLVLYRQTRQQLREAAAKPKPGRPKHYVFAYRPPTKAFNLKISFTKSRATKEEVIDALEGIIRELRAGR